MKEHRWCRATDTRC